MKMLHAFSENGTGDIDVQMNHLIERVVLMQERADVLRSEERAFRMKLILHIRCWQPLENCWQILRSEWR